jgi:nicotinate-nucleotide--dimethylbenzimidazole phosphoribosyltransferase
MEFDLVSLPDEAVKQSAEERHAQLTKPRGSLGRLEELGTWLAACQGLCPPRPLRRPRVVVFAGDHGVAAKGVSAYPSEVTAQMVANFQAGGAAINVLAAVAGATVRVVDMAVAVDTSAGEHKVRKSSGSIDHEDALSAAEVEAALAAGKAIADEEIDGGADLLVAGDMGIGNTTPAAVLIAAITGSEPVAVVGRGTGIDDQAWMRKTAAIRDALRRAKPVTADPVALLRTTAGADITAMAAFLAQAAVRKTPVVLDGVISGAAALLAEELAPGARSWWVAGHRSTEPAHTLVLEQLDLKPLLEMNMRLGEGSGATAAIPLLTMAVDILNNMATFADAGVSGPAAEAPGDEALADEDEAEETPAEGAAEEPPADPMVAEALAADSDAAEATAANPDVTEALAIDSAVTGAPAAGPAATNPPAAERAAADAPESSGTAASATGSPTAESAGDKPAASAPNGEAPTGPANIKSAEGEPVAPGSPATQTAATQTAATEPAATQPLTDASTTEPATEATAAESGAAGAAGIEPSAAEAAETEPATGSAVAKPPKTSAEREGSVGTE